MTAKARTGADHLVHDLAGLNATRNGHAFHLNVVGHSYGTTTASFALAKAELDVHAFVSVASAGIDRAIDRSGDIHAEHVFAEQAQNVIPGLEAGNGDEWAWVGRVGGGRGDPMDPQFGAHRFSAAGVAGDTELQGVTAHDQLVHSDSDPESGYGYFDANTESLKNVALATTQHGDRVSPYVEPLPTPLQLPIRQTLSPLENPF